jgi:hypothetical protein
MPLEYHAHRERQWEHRACLSDQLMCEQTFAFAQVEFFFLRVSFLQLEQGSVELVE